MGCKVIEKTRSSLAGSTVIIDVIAVRKFMESRVESMFNMAYAMFNTTACQWQYDSYHGRITLQSSSNGRIVVITVGNGRIVCSTCIVYHRHACIIRTYAQLIKVFRWLFVEMGREDV